MTVPEIFARLQSFFTDPDNVKKLLESKFSQEFETGVVSGDLQSFHLAQVDMYYKRMKSGTKASSEILKTDPKSVLQDGQSLSQCLDAPGLDAAEGTPEWNQ